MVLSSGEVWREKKKQKAKPGLVFQNRAEVEMVGKEADWKEEEMRMIGIL